MDLSRHLQESAGPRTAWPTLAEYRAAKATYAEFRRSIGRAPAALIGSTAANYKLGKGTAPTVGLELYPGTIRPDAVPADLAPLFESIGDRVNVCRWSTASCDPGRGGGCLGAHAGRNSGEFVQRGKLARSLFAAIHPAEFVTLAVEETRRAVAKGRRVRLNVTSDLEWHRIAPVLFAPGSPTRGRIYDYTKDWRRRADGWHLTYSASERQGPAEIAAMITEGRNVSVVLDTRRGEPLPARWHGLVVVDGDETDNRWTDPRGVVVGLRAKSVSKSRGLSVQSVSLRTFVKPAATPAA